MTEETPAAILRRWSKENQGADRGWLVVCERMASSPDMEAAWPSLLAAGAKPLQVFNMVTTSITESNRDIRRLAGKEELKSIEEVKKATSALLIALQGAQLLNESAPFIDINNDIGLIAWTDYRAKILGRVHSNQT